MKGFRQQPQASRKDKLRELEVKIANMEMASRINSMMTQQIVQRLNAMHEDVVRVTSISSELQYKVLAVQEVSGLDVEQMNAVANRKRLIDFDEASMKEDVARNFTVGTVVDAQSTVILTTKTEGEDRGIFRSRLKLVECGVPDLIEAFTGREVGARALVVLNGIEHEVELLGIRQPAELVVAANPHPDNAPTKVASDESLLATAEVVGTA